MFYSEGNTQARLHPGPEGPARVPGGRCAHTCVPKQTRVHTVLPGPCPAPGSRQSTSAADMARLLGWLRTLQAWKVSRDLALLFRIISFPSVPHKTLPRMMDASLVRGGRRGTGGGEAQEEKQTLVKPGGPRDITWEQNAPEELGCLFSCTDRALPSAQQGRSHGQHQDPTPFSWPVRAKGP